MDLQRLVDLRVDGNPKMSRHLQRALTTTGQQAIRFPNPWEDAATLAAQAAYRLIQEGADFDLSRLRHLAVGTETPVDQAKPLSAYVQGMLQKAGVSVPESLSSFQVQHACASGTMALLAVTGLLAVAGLPGECGIVASADIARYEPGSTAEVTQGAGAVALLVEPDPRLLELDLAGAGYCSRDTDDFFRPNGWQYPSVQGRHSMDLYIDNLRRAFLDHCRRRQAPPAEVLESTDMFALHTPFRSMPELAMRKLLGEHLSLSPELSRRFLEDRGFYRGLEPLARIGNTYSASLYVFLSFLLRERYQALGAGIVGRRVLLASYGSGNTMIVFSGAVAPAAPQIIERWDLDRELRSARPASVEEYQLWAAGPNAGNGGGRAAGAAGNGGIAREAFHLHRVRPDGYREYRYAADGADWFAQREAPVDLHRSSTIPG